MATPEDLRFGKVAVQLKLIGADLVNKCFQIQKQLSVRGKYLPISAILLKKGHLAADDVRRIQEQCAALDGQGPLQSLGTEPRSVPVRQGHPPPATEIIQGTGKRILGQGGETPEYPAPLQQTGTLPGTETRVVGQGETIGEGDWAARKNFGRYRILEEIGRGGMGRVYKAHDPELDRVVALKMLLSGETAREEEIQRFLREAKATARLRHPNIVAVYDMGNHEGAYFFTMDFIEGTSLKALLEKSRLGFPEILHIMVRVCDAIHYAHTNDIIHRDLKPANIMLDGREPKVMDFGLAKMIKDSAKLSHSGMILGTLQYMAPEQAQGDPNAIDARSDVYALGVVLYEMLTGKPPFDGDSAFSIIHKIMTQNPVPPKQLRKSVPVSLQNICMKALAKKKEDRYHSAKEMAQDLEKFSRGKAVAVRAATGAPKAKKSKVMWSALAILVILLVVAVAVAGRKSPATESADATGKETANPSAAVVAETAEPFKMSARIVDDNEEGREQFGKGEPVLVEISWVVAGKIAGAQGKVAVYGSGVKAYEENFDAAPQDRKICRRLELIDDRDGPFEITAQVKVGEIIRDRQLNFSITPETMSSDREQEALTAYRKIDSNDDPMLCWEALQRFSREYPDTGMALKAHHRIETVEKRIGDDFENLTCRIQEAMDAGDLEHWQELEGIFAPGSAQEQILQKIGRNNPSVEEKLQNLHSVIAAAKERFTQLAEEREMERRREKWEAFLQSDWLDLLCEGKFEEARRRLEEFVGMPHGDPEVVEEMLRDLDDIITLPQKMNDAFRFYREQQDAIAVSTIEGKRVEGKVITVKENERILLMDDRKKTHSIEFIEIQGACLRKILGKKKEESARISYCSGMRSLQTQKKWAIRHLRDAADQGHHQAGIFLEILENPEREKIPKPTHPEREKILKPIHAPSAGPEGWPPDLWEECWDKEAKLVDFTASAWEQLSVSEQLRYASSYREWYARQAGILADMEWKADGIPFSLALIPPGRFYMLREVEEWAHPVTIESPFYMGKYEVTQAQWQKLTGESPWQDIGFPSDEKLPAICMSWERACEFCQDHGVSLPSESQWEYACRSGTTTLYHWGDEFEKKYCNRSKKLRQIETCQPNAFGLWEMSGNVYEWCMDDWHDNFHNASSDGAPVTGSENECRVVRGGCFESSADDCASCARSDRPKCEPDKTIGLRIALPVPNKRQR